MSLSSCSVPGSRPTFELSADEVELGLGKPVPPLSSHACHLRFAPVPTWPSLLPWSHHLGGPSIFKWAHEVLVAQPAWFLPTLPPIPRALAAWGSVPCPAPCLCSHRPGSPAPTKMQSHSEVIPAAKLSRFIPCASRAMGRGYMWPLCDRLSLKLLG